MIQLPVLFLLLLAIGLLLFFGFRFLGTRSAVTSRLRSESDEVNANELHSAMALHEFDGLRGWLFRAGIRRKQSSLIFLVTTSMLLLMGLIIREQLESIGVIPLLIDLVRSIPGGVGNVLVPFVLAVPWFFVLLLTLLPTLFVRSIRRKRVKAIEQDLPLLLDLLNTLSQAGIGFDSALEQVLNAAIATRPLTVEFRGLQVDILAGRSREYALKLLMRRVDIPMFSAFISAVLQAELIGAGMSETLKIQAKEIRERRRERASAAAMAVPTLLVVPMVIGFLPGIFIVLLGPILFEALGAMEQTLRGVSG